MPYYQYQCKTCGHLFDLDVPMAEVTATAYCIACGRVASRNYTPIPTIWKCGGNYGGKKNNEKNTN